MEGAARESCVPGAGEVEPDPWFPALYPGSWLGLWGGIFACVKPGGLFLI